MFFLVINIVFSELPSKVVERRTITKKYINFNSSVKGLENAILRVRNNETSEHLQTVLNKILEHRKLILAKLQNLQITKINDTEIVAEGRRNAKFLSFLTLKHKYKYTITEQGDVIRKKIIFDLLWKDEADIE